jgi:hypothetical protein
MRIVRACILLDDLAEWHMLGPRIEAAKDAVRGGPGITKDELRLLEECTDVWCNLVYELRVFYRALAPRNETASVALWRILHGGPPLEPWQDGMLRRLWEETTGCSTSMELCPRPPPTDRPVTRRTR